MTKTVVVTGASGGLGKEFVHQYLEKKYKVIGIDIEMGSLEKINDKNFIFYKCDLTHRQSLSNVMSEIQKIIGIPDIWINNAGIVNMDSFLNESENKFDQVMQINFHAPMRIMKILIPLMEQNGGGKVVNVSSVAGLISAPIISSYCASKFALVGLTESVQQELEIKNSPVDLILVCPGFIQTELIKLGQKNGFPEHLKHFLSTSENAVSNIIKGIENNKKFIDPTINGKVMSMANRFGPKLLKNMAAKLAIPEALKQKIKN